MNDERLRELYGRGISGRRAGGDGATPCDVAPEALLALVRGELPEEERLDLLDRVMADERCRADFELLRAVEVAGRELERAEREGGQEEGGGRGSAADEGKVLELRPAASAAASGRPTADAPAAAGVRARRAAPWWRRSAMPFALAATALLAVGITVRQRDAVVGGVEVTRGDAGGVALLAPAAGSLLIAGAPLQFAWRPADGATRYQFELLAADGTVVHETTTADTVVALAQPALQPGTEYRWLVRAVDAAGTQRGSAVRALRVRE